MSSKCSAKVSFDSGNPFLSFLLWKYTDNIKCITVTLNHKALSTFTLLCNHHHRHLQNFIDCSYNSAPKTPKLWPRWSSRSWTCSHACQNQRWTQPVKKQLLGHWLLHSKAQRLLRDEKPLGQALQSPLSTAVSSQAARQRGAQAGPGGLPEVRKWN